MTIQLVNIGSRPSDGSGDPIRVAYDKINQNFVEVYTALGGIVGNGNVITGNTISPVTSVAGKVGAVQLTVNDIAGSVTQGYVANQISATVADEFNALVDAAPTTLDTLRELADAINGDPNFAVDIISRIDLRLLKTGGTLSGPLYLHADPTYGLQAATKQYVDLRVNPLVAGLPLKANAADVYTKSEINQLLLNINSSNDNWGSLTSDPMVDWGSISDPATETEDYGSI